MKFETIHEIRNRFFIKHEAPEEIANTIDYSELLEEFKELGIVFDDHGTLSWHGRKIGGMNKSYAVSLLRKMMVRIIIREFMIDDQVNQYEALEKQQIALTVMKISPEIMAMDIDFHNLISVLIDQAFTFDATRSKWIELEYAGQKLGAFVNPYSSQSTIADTNYEAVVQILKLLVTPFMLKNYQPAVKVVLNEEDE